MKPLVCFVTWNRMGINILNLNLLLETTDDFDLYIVDNNSEDDSWEYIKTLKDPRIIEKKRFYENLGACVACNYAISKRKPGQPFVNVDADVGIVTPNWIQNCEKIIKQFPEIGVLGNIRHTYYKEKNLRPLVLVRNGIMFHKTRIIGNCMYFPSKTLDLLGYFNEDLSLGDSEVSERLRVLKLWSGYNPYNRIVLSQADCSKCEHNGLCSEPNNLYCHRVYRQNYKQRDHYLKTLDKFKKWIKQLNKNNVYCGSRFDSA